MGGIRTSENMDAHNITMVHKDLYRVEIVDLSTPPNATSFPTSWSATCSLNALIFSSNGAQPVVRWAGTLPVSSNSESRISGLRDASTSARSFCLTPCPLVSSRIASVFSVCLHLPRTKIVAFPQTEHYRFTRLVGRLASTHRPMQTTPLRLASPTALVSRARFGNSIAGLEMTILYIG